MTATYPAMHQSAYPQATYTGPQQGPYHSTQNSPATPPAAPNRPADLYRPRYFAGGGSSAASSSYGGSTGTGYSRVPKPPMARAFEVPPDGGDPGCIKLNSVDASKAMPYPIVNSGASHHITGDRIGSLLFPSPKGGDVVVPDVLYYQ